MFLEKKSWLKGYVTIKVIGEYPEKFFLSYVRKMAYNHGI